MQQPTDSNKATSPLGGVRGSRLVRNEPEESIPAAEVIAYLIAQVRTVEPYRLVARTLVPALAPLLVMAYLHERKGIDIENMTRDVAAIGHLHPLSGFLSSLGVLLWWSSACIWLFCARLHRAVGITEAAKFALCSGLLSSYLAIDDLFQFHESLAPGYLAVSENVIQGLLALAIASYLWRFRNQLARPDGALLVFACAMLSLSVIGDHLLGRWVSALGDWTSMLEDGLKWVGIACWCAFCVSRCHSDIQQRAIN